MGKEVVPMSKRWLCYLPSGKFNEYYNEYKEVLVKCYLTYDKQVDYK